MKTHELKAWPAFFDATWRGHKTAEVRKDDRGFAADDGLRLREWIPGEAAYSGREIDAVITHVLGPGLGMEFGLRPGFALLSVRVLSKFDRV